MISIATSSLENTTARSSVLSDEERSDVFTYGPVILGRNDLEASLLHQMRQLGRVDGMHPAGCLPDELQDRDGKPDQRVHLPHTRCLGDKVTSGLHHSADERQRTLKVVHKMDVVDAVDGSSAGIAMCHICGVI